MSKAYLKASASSYPMFSASRFDIQAPKEFMRLSINTTDPGYEAYRLLDRRKLNAEIFLNGVRMNSIVTADVNHGFIERIAHDETGKVMMRGDQAVIQRLQGYVEIRVTPK